VRSAPLTRWLSTLGPKRARYKSVVQISTCTRLRELILHHIYISLYSSNIKLTATTSTSKGKQCILRKRDKVVISTFDLLSYAASRETQAAILHLISNTSRDSPFKDLRKPVGHDRLLDCQRSTCNSGSCDTYISSNEPHTKRLQSRRIRPAQHLHSSW
jgi:hypothetical protein